MSRAIEIVLKDSFIKLVGVYLRSFPRAYFKAGGEPADYGKNFAVYKSVIESYRDDVFRAAASGINKYLNFFLIRADASVDEFKIIYFLGRAIERRLSERGLAPMAKAHSYAMVGLLDFRLQTLDIKKPRLTKAMILVADAAAWEEQLGQNGCYLIYKTVATTPECVEKAA
ncbi:hypothetical protein WG901_10115 [Novosphingobium sp. PS1R-30]|uniref:Uncharacterized protein n=1 Tax=Novosphingobium anseongense TaxID=3133436 RepID=A0ABU8RVF9_9SPHN